jgi:hypothetical protein
MKRIYPIVLLLLGGSWWLTTPEVSIADATSASQSNKSEKPRYRKPLPPEVVELIGVLGIGNSLVELKDGSLLSNDGRISRDGGKTWSPPHTFAPGIAGSQIMRLKSGKLLLTNGGRRIWMAEVPSEAGIWLSKDEGKTWGTPRAIQQIGEPLYATLIQLRSGRLLQPNRACFGNMEHVGLTYEKDSAWGTCRGWRYQVEGHGHLPEVSIGAVCYSDDEGATWKSGNKGDTGNAPYSSAILMGWFGTDGKPTTGDGWITDTDEPSVAETKDGRVLFFARSTVGRIVQSYSGDGGLTWTPVAPTELASSYSPPRLVRIPKTGDLMCVWNQVSPEEIRRGFRQGRLSVAISQDSGATWNHFKTLELSSGLEDVAWVTPRRIEMVIRARKDVGRLPDDYAFFHYANVCFARDKVYLMYSRGGPVRGVAEQNLNVQEQVLRICPLDWFYQ